ncbi:MAG: PIG-L family deacetylase [Planctomycetes bacterium]|nr:PIG-L family deacetylase [Planctomycetota bacterium]
MLFSLPMDKSPALEDFLSRQRLLVISPHADDETAGAGGLMLRIKEAGGEVYVMVLTVGDLQHYDSKDEKTFASERSVELGNAMNTLGVDDWEICFNDSDIHLRLDNIPRRDIVSRIERDSKLAIDRIKPTMLALPAPSFNQDHEILYKAGITAARPHLYTLKPFQRCVLTMDAPQLAWGEVNFKPNFYVDISHCLDKKIEAFNCHKSQLRPDPHQGGSEALRLLALSRGREISVQAAESYECMRFVF